MRLFVSGVGFFLIVSEGLAGAQTAPAPDPAAHAEAPAPAQAAFPPLEPTPAPTSTAPPPAATQPPPPAQPATRALTPESDKPVSVQATPIGDAQEQAASQSYFGFGVQAGFYDPNGLTVRVGVPAIALQVSAGFAPLLLSYQSYSSGERNALKFLMPFEVSPQLVLHAINLRHEMRGNLLLGYRHNRVLGNGFTFGGELESRVTRKLVLLGSWGISIYSEAENRLRGDQVPADTDFKFPPWFGYGFSVCLLFYP